MYINFEDPQYLWLLISIPILILSHIYYMKRSKSKGLQFANFEALKRISGDKILTSNTFHLIMRCLILFFLIMSISGATFFHQAQHAENNVVFALDGSPSMSTQDVDPNRFEFAREQVRTLTEDIDSVINMGLISYGGVTYIHQQITDSRLRFRNSLDEPQILQTGGTDLSSAIVNAANMLEVQDEGGKTMVIYSDGVETTSAYLGDPLQQAIEYANQKNMVIHTVGVGSEGEPAGFLPEYYNISSWYKEENLRYLAEETRGTFIDGTDPDAIEQTAEEVEGELVQAYIPTELGGISLLVAFTLLIVEWGLANTIYRRLA